MKCNLKKFSSNNKYLCYHLKFKIFLNFRALFFEHSIANCNSFNFLKQQQQKNQKSFQLKKDLILTDRSRCSSNHCTISTLVRSSSRASLASTLNSSRARTIDSIMANRWVKRSLAVVVDRVLIDAVQRTEQLASAYVISLITCELQRRPTFFCEKKKEDFGHETTDIFFFLKKKSSKKLTFASFSRFPTRPKQSASAAHRCAHRKLLRVLVANLKNDTRRDDSELIICKQSLQKCCCVPVFALEENIGATLRKIWQRYCENLSKLKYHERWKKNEQTHNISL